MYCNYNRLLVLDITARYQPQTKKTICVPMKIKFVSVVTSVNSVLIQLPDTNSMSVYTKQEL